MNELMIMLILLGVITLVFTFFLIKDVLAHKDEKPLGANGANSPLWISGLIGALTNFLDTLGIGSFAPTTALFKVTKVVDDEVIPGTLNVAHTLPVVLMAFLFITSVEVEFMTLAVLLAAATLGSWIGAGIVSKFPKHLVQLVMGIALFITAGLMIANKFEIIAGFGTGDATGLSGGLLVIGAIANFILGALMTAGVGLYAPCMAMVFILGLSPDIAFPVMMGSCAFLMPVAGIKFVKEGKYARQQSLAVSLFGLVGVVLAFSLFRNLDVSSLMWLVIGVIILTSISMIKSYMKTKSEVSS